MKILSEIEQKKSFFVFSLICVAFEYYV